MKYLLTTFFIATAILSFAQLSETEILEKRKEHLNHLKDSSSHLLTAEEIEGFEGLDYFEVNPDFQITATFQKSKGKKFEMPTSTDRTPIYRRYGYLYFEMDGKQQQLEVYQNVALTRKKEYRDYLFIPFRDATSGEETYGGGRYLDFKIPRGKEALIDFNLSYNPYCAYSYRYSCPIPPKENTLDVKVFAGEKTPLGH